MGGVRALPGVPIVDLFILVLPGVRRDRVLPGVAGGAAPSIADSPIIIPGVPGVPTIVPIIVPTTPIKPPSLSPTEKSPTPARTPRALPSPPAPPLPPYGLLAGGVISSDPYPAFRAALASRRALVSLVSLARARDSSTEYAPIRSALFKTIALTTNGATTTTITHPATHCNKSPCATKSPNGANNTSYTSAATVSS